MAGVLAAATPGLSFATRVYGPADGVRASAFNAVAQTPDGFVWLGGDSGLVRFDGIQFAAFDDSSNPSPGRSGVRHLLATTNGTLWIATGDGLYSYSDARMRRWGPPDGLVNEVIRVLLESGDGRLRVGTDGGGLFVQRDGRFEPELLPDPAARSINGLAESLSGDRICTVDNGGVFLWTGGAWRSLALPAPAPGVRQFPTGAFRADDGSVQVLSTDGVWIPGADGLKRRPLPEWLDRAAVLAAVAEPGGAEWFAGAKALGRLRPGTQERFEVGAGFSTRGAGLLLFDQEGSLWALPENSGPTRIRPAGFTRIGSTNGLASDEVTSVATSTNGTVWVAGARGIDRVSDGRTEHFGKEQGLRDPFHFSLHLDASGVLWAGSRLAGLSRLENGRFTPVPDDPIGGREPVWCLAGGSNGRVYAGTRYGLLSFRDGRFERWWRGTNGLSNEDVRCLLEDRRGNLWVGTSYGLNLLRDGRVVTNWVSLPGGKLDTVASLLEGADGSVWIGSLEHGLHRHHEGRFQTFTSAAGLPADSVHGMLRDSAGRLWIGSAAGLFVVDEAALVADLDRGTRKAGFRRFRVADGLPTDEFTGTVQPTAAVSADGHLWFATGAGLVVANPEELLRPSLPPRPVVERMLVDLNPGMNPPEERGAGTEWRVVTADRLREKGPPPGVPSPAQLRAGGPRKRGGGPGPGEESDRRRRPREGGEDGAPPPREDGPDGPPTDRPPRDGEEPPQDRPEVERRPQEGRPRPRMGGETNRRRESRPNDEDRRLGIPLPESEIRLPAGSRFVEFHFTAPTFVEPAAIRFEYRLDGVDEGWNTPIGQYRADYAGLAPGDYRFRLRVRAREDSEASPEATVALHIEPFWYQTRAARLSPFLLLGGLVYGGYRWRLGRTERERDAQIQFSRRLIGAQESERRRLAAELHDSLSQTLLVMKNRAWMGQQAGPLPEKAARQLAEIHTEAEAALEEVRALSHALRPPELDRLGLTRAFTALCERLSDGGGPRLESQVDAVDGLLPTEDEINLFRIAQEALNNAVKHADARNLRLTLSRKADSLELRIDDDGRGFDTEAVRSAGLGLTGLQERAGILRGTLEIRSQPGQGTTVIAVVPLRDSQPTPDSGPTKA